MISSIVGHLAQVVAGHVGRHAHRDAGGAVDQQVGQAPGQHDRLVALPVEGGAELDGVLVELGQHLLGGRGQPTLGVAVGSGWIIEAAEVAVRVDQRDDPGEVLTHAGEGVVDGPVAVRVVFAHRLADHAGALTVRSVGAQPHVLHGVEDAALHRLEAVPYVGDGPRRDHRQGVGEEGLGHLLGDRYVQHARSK